MIHNTLLHSEDGSEVKWFILLHTSKVKRWLLNSLNLKAIYNYIIEGHWSVQKLVFQQVAG